MFSLASTLLAIVFGTSLGNLVRGVPLDETGFFSIVDHPSEGKLRSMAVPSKWSASPPAAPRPAPRLGEHSMEVLREAGYSDAEINAMIAAGATTVASA